MVGTASNRLTAKRKRSQAVFWSMVDWDRVEQLRSKGWDWDRIAADPKVGFHPEASVRDEGRALRALYHRHRSKEGRRESEPTRPTRKDEGAHERRWTLPRIGYLLVPIVGLWALLAYVAPSPVGVLIPAFPDLLIALAGAAFVLFFGLLRTQEKRWTPVFRTTLIMGIILGLVVAGVLGISSYVLGCPYLPPASSLASEPGGWSKATVSPWKEGGVPVFYFYGATWCPYCSASSWAMWKALTEFQSGFSGTVNGIPGATFMYSSDDPAGPYTPEVVLGTASVTSSVVALQTSEYLWTPTSGVEGTFPGTSNCIQQAYVSAYSNGIPFNVVNGQYVHTGTLIEPSDMSSWSNGAMGGYSAVANGVLTESGNPWSIVSTQASLITALILKSDGYSTVSGFLAANPGLSNPGKYQWTTTMTNLVNTDLGQIS